MFEVTIFTLLILIITKNQFFPFLQFTGYFESLSFFASLMKFITLSAVNLFFVDISSPILFKPFAVQVLHVFIKWKSYPDL